MPDVALIAITRKVIILDDKEYSGLSIIGIAALIHSLSTTYYFLHRTMNAAHSKVKPGGH